MTRIRRLRLVLPAHLAPQADRAARDIAERMVDGAWDTGLSSGPTLHLTDTGQSPAQIGLEAGRTFRKPTSSNGSGGHDT